MITTMLLVVHRELQFKLEKIHFQKNCNNYWWKIPKTNFDKGIKKDCIINAEIMSLLVYIFFV